VDDAPQPQPERQRVAVTNRADGGVFYWLGKLYGFTAIVAAVAIALASTVTYAYFSERTPPPRDLRTYTKVAPAVTKMFAADGTLLGEFAKEWREFTPYERIPPQLVNAFLAIEDHDYWNHSGIYFKGVARALWANITAADFAQGGSTIEQQVSKQFLGAEKSLSRKAKEAIMARRLEATYSKKAILAVYLNQIYLGAGAYGVTAAAQRYFGKELPQLTLAECATIAGLAKAPTAYSPTHHAAQAIDRRNRVLDKMLEYGMASAADVDAAKKSAIELHPYRDVFPDRMPYYAEHVRRYLTEKYGNDAVFSNGLRVETAAEPTWEAAAYENADYGARHQDKRQGWRGPEWRVDGAARDTVLQRQSQLYGDGPLEPGKRYLAVVDKVDSEHAEVLVGKRRLQLPLRDMAWASKWQAGNADNDVEIESATQALRPGYVVWVSREIRERAKFRDFELPDKINPTWVGASDAGDKEWDAAHPDVVKLEQPPHPQTAIFTADHHSGYVVAMVGGSDYDRSVFNRTVQACRQPGSTYKPIYYALGLKEGYGFDSVFGDQPVEITDDNGSNWTPENLDNASSSSSTLEYALVFSKNIPSVELFHEMRTAHVDIEGWIRSMGFTTKLYVDDALALGASCSKLDEMARGFSLFARLGAWWPRQDGKGHERDWIYVRRVLDRDGNAIEDNTVAEDPQLASADRFDRDAALAGVQAPQAIPARTAFLMTKLLEHEVEYGFANVLRATDIKAAGKTGTSSATSDNMFIAFTSKFTTLVWMGDDKRVRGLGKTDAAYMTVVPLWSRYMFEAARGYPNPDIPWKVPPGVKPDDRGDMTRGQRGQQMDLIWHRPLKKQAADDGA
jgi:penicillin-binding protein 1A